MTAKNDSEHTVNAYRYDLRQFCKVNKDGNILEDIDEKVSHYLNKIYSVKRRFANSSLSRKITSLRSFYRFLYDEGKIDKIPMKNIRAPKIRVPAPKMLLQSEIDKILKQCLKNFEENREKIEWILLYALIEFLYSTGCRISEALSVKIGTIFNNRDEILNEIIICGKRKEERLIFLNHVCQKAILHFLHEKFQGMKVRDIRVIDGFLFSIDELSQNSVTRHKIYYLLRSAATQCGIDPFRVSPHVLRHSVAIHMLMSKNSDSANNIMTIKKFLGHKSIDTTKIYLGYDNINDLSRTVNTKHPLASLLQK